MKRITWLASISFATLGLLPPATADEKPVDRVFVGYLFGAPRDIHFSLYTHLCHAFLVADEDGNVRANRGVPSRPLAEDAHRHGVKMVLSLGGWGWDRQFAAIVSKPESEDRYVSSVMKLVDESDYDGIDLDWEYPDTEAEIVGFERLTSRFRRQLDALGKTKGRPMVLTMAVSSNPGTIRWLKTEFIVANFDWLNMMTYDYTGDWTNFAGHHSPLFASSREPGGGHRSTELTMKYLLNERRLPADRLAVGIPLYGRAFGVKEPYASTRGASKPRMREGGYAALVRLMEKDGWKRQWDDETKNPWLLAPDGSAVVGYDDAESVAIKTKWALDQGFRGVFFWQINADRMPNGSNPLQESARKAWDAGHERAK